MNLSAERYYSFITKKIAMKSLKNLESKAIKNATGIKGGNKRDNEGSTSSSDSSSTLTTHCVHL